MRWLYGITDLMGLSLTSSGSWWWRGKPGVLQSMGLQIVRHDWETELTEQQQEHLDSCLTALWKMTGWIMLRYPGFHYLSWSSFSWGCLKKNLLKWVQYSFDSPVPGKNLFKFMCVWIKPCSGFIWFLPHVETLFWYRPKARSSKWRQNGGFKRLTFHELLIVRFPSVIENSVFNALD